MSTALGSKNGLGLKNTLSVDADVESVGSLNGQASFADSSCRNVGEARH
jgi:hypothetical protein